MMHEPYDKEKYGRLNTIDFEDFISVGTSVENLCAIFMVDRKQLDWFCREVYHVDFNTAYSFLLQLALAEYKKTLSELAMGGNATAINTMNQIVLNMSNSTELKVSVMSNVPVEEEKNDAN